MFSPNLDPAVGLALGPTCHMGWRLLYSLSSNFGSGGGPLLIATQSSGDVRLRWRGARSATAAVNVNRHWTSAGSTAKHVPRSFKPSGMVRQALATARSASLAAVSRGARRAASTTGAGRRVGAISRGAWRAARVTGTGRSAGRAVLGRLREAFARGIARSLSVLGAGNRWRNASVTGRSHAEGAVARGAWRAGRIAAFARSVSTVARGAWRAGKASGIARSALAALAGLLKQMAVRIVDRTGQRYHVADGTNPRYDVEERTRPRHRVE